MLNMSQMKRKRMIDFLNKLKAKCKDNEDIIAINEIENELINKKYGLVWEEHEESVDVLMQKNVPVFVEVEDQEIRALNNNDFNFLLEGDNLHCLKLLSKTHRNKIDLIYIDPPYNTGSEDFIYDDNYVNEDDGFKHSKWLSFMAERLKIAKGLLTTEGVIFIQISDIEVAQLKMLCDEIFGENNFLNILSVNMKNIAGASGGGEDKKFKKNCEYILVYAREYTSLPLFNGSYTYTEMSELIQQYIEDGKSWKYTTVLIDPGEKEYYGSTIDGDGNEIKVYLRKNPVTMSVKQVAKRDGISEKEAYHKYGTKIFRTTNAQSSIRTRIMAYRKEEQILESLISIEYVPKTGKNKGKTYEQFYKDDKCNLFVWLKDTSEEIDGVLYKKDLQGTYWDATAGMKNLTKEGNIEFSNGKKPISLLKQIISLYPSKDITVLDFFAGSGSLGHAVISLNAEDDGTRKFIICTNNEVKNKDRDKYLMSRGYVKNEKDIKSFIQTDVFKEICNTEDYQKLGIARNKTYPRLYNVINGYTTDKGKVIEPEPSNLKWYRTKMIPKASNETNYSVGKTLLRHIKEMVQLENGIAIDGSKYILVLSPKQMDELENNPERLRDCKAVYLSVRILLSQKQKRLLKEVEVIGIPDYYFETELQEVGER